MIQQSILTQRLPGTYMGYLEMGDNQHVAFPQHYFEVHVILAFLNVDNFLMVKMFMLN